ncbi:MAG TPA: CoA transferase [Caulobacteraceae bacterium]|jgi:crotonobetainyl-CoA:carnitine CoA-transferase CaiB-like acyl-CoA transferase|nr:CoA transferase [Caulobacteraceae bacterium]
MDGSQASPQARGPLDGVRVVDLTQFVLGPYATQTLGDLGADIIKVEEPAGDRQRHSGKAPRSKTMGPVYIALNRNKRSIALDLKTNPGRRALRKLVRTADIFIHNMRPEAVARLGFDYASVAAIKPDIVYVEAMGYAPEGPYAGRQAFDDLIQSASGAAGLAQLVDPDAPLQFVPSIIADKTCGLFAAIASLAALRHKERTGEGQYVCVPMLETFTGFIMAEHLYGETWLPALGHFGHTTTITPYRKPLRTLDGWIMVMPANREQAARFFELGGIPGAYESERFRSADGSAGKVRVYNEMLAEAAASRTTEDWLVLCAEASVPAMRANTAAGVLSDPQLTQTLFETRQIENEGPYRALRPGLRFARTPAAIRRDPPEVGRDTAEVLAEIGESLETQQAAE